MYETLKSIYVKMRSMQKQCVESIQSTAFYRMLLRICCRIPLLADIWFLVNGHFRREHTSILAGQLSYLTALKDKQEQGAEFLLRRNTHRLEKGLIMRPRRGLFATLYLLETVEVYCALKAKQEQEPSETLGTLLLWATDVLSEYFSVVDETPLTTGCREQFLKAKTRTAEQGGSQSSENNVDAPIRERAKSPYARRPSDLPEISVEQLHQLAIHRRSCRWYTQEKVSRSLIDKAVEVAMLSPSACNRQPFRFVIFDDPQAAADVGSIPMGTVGFNHNFPAVAVVVGQLNAFPHDRDRHVIYIDSALASMAFQFALEVQGIGSCCINWPDIESRERRMSKRLGLKAFERPIMLISFGYPDQTGRVPYSQKKTLDEMRVYSQ